MHRETRLAWREVWGEHKVSIVPSASGLLTNMHKNRTIVALTSLHDPLPRSGPAVLSASGPRMRITPAL